MKIFFSGSKPLGNLARWLLAWLQAERDRWALWIPVAIGAGVAGYFTLPVEPPLWAGPVGLGLLSFLLFVLPFGGKASGGLRALMYAAILVGLGFSAASLRTHMVAAPQLEGRIGPTTVQGRVLDVEAFPDGVRLTLDRLAISGLPPDGTPNRVRLRLRGGQPPVHPGDWVRARAIVSPPSAPAAPGAFDFQRHAYFQQLGGYGFALGAVDVYRAADDPPAGLRLGVSLENAWVRIAEYRHAIVGRILAAFGPDDTAIAGMAAALMTGERRAIPEPVLEDMRRSGIAHLLAISGLHVGLVAGLLFFGVRAVLALVPRLALRAPIKKWAALVALLGAFAYALIAGATVPTQRAFLMIGVVLLAVMLDRRGLSMRMVAFAATVILLMRPESLLGASFQMSFAAVVALIAVYERYTAGVRDGHGGGRRVWAYLVGVVVTTLVAGAATAPFAAFHFNRVADFGLVTNLVAVPVTALWVMPWAIVAFVLMPMGLEGLALAPMGWGIAVVKGAAQAVSSWPSAVTYLPAGNVLALACVTIGGLWLCLWQRRIRYAGAGVLMAGVVWLSLAKPPDILIGEDGKLLAVQMQAADGTPFMAFSTETAKRFERAIWQRRQGEAGWETGGPVPTFAALASQPVAGQPGVGLTCDELGCVYEKAGVRAALVQDGLALAEDCAAPQIDVVIATVPARGRCRGPRIVIDRFDLWKHGAHAIWIGKDGTLKVETVAARRGQRPWVPGS